MEKTEALEKLGELLQIINDFENAEKKYKDAEKSLNFTKYSYSSKLDKFDNDHKAKFITEKIGSKPRKPHGVIKLAVPVYFIKKTKYKSVKANYDRLYPLAEAAYREKYADERNRLAEEDKIEQKKEIEKKEEELSVEKNKYETAKVAFDTNDLLSEKLKSREIVTQLIDFFKDQRADTLKEAVNLWFDEKRKNEEEEKAAAHRQKMLELEEERVRAAQAAEEYAQMQYFEACDAADYARKAAEDAQEAVDAAHRMEWND